MKKAIPIFFLIPAISTAAVFKCVDRGSVIYSAEPCGADSKLISDMPLSHESGGPSYGHKVVLVRDAAGMYKGRGTVKGVPVTFIVDTGASRTTISRRVASAAGFRTCESPGLNITANGLASSCTVNADIEFVGIIIKNHRVTILQNLTFDMLLGMDVLQLMKIEQKNGLMIISTDE